MEGFNFLVRTVRCKLINFVFQVFPLFIPEMPAGFTSYTVQIIPIYLNTVTTSIRLVSFDLIILSILHGTMDILLNQLSFTKWTYKLTTQMRTFLEEVSQLVKNFLVSFGT
jgi:hypothetical protein